MISEVLCGSACMRHGVAKLSHWCRWNPKERVPEIRAPSRQTTVESQSTGEAAGRNSPDQEHNSLSGLTACG